MRELILARHAHAASNAADVVSCVPPGAGLSKLGIEEAMRLRDALADESIELGVATEMARTRETLEIALAGRDVPTLMLSALNEIGFGRFEGGPLVAYREWAWSAEPDAECPGGGESRASAAVRFASALDTLLARDEEVVLAVAHAVPVRYVLDASDERFPAARVEPVPHAVPFRLSADQVDAAAVALRVWAEAPRFSDLAQG